MASLPALTSAATDQWIGGSSNWNNSANWNTNVVPGSADTVNVTSTLGAAQTITYDYAGTAQLLSVVTVSLLNGTGGASETLLMSGNTLQSSFETVGGYLSSPGKGNGTFNQSGGLNQAGANGLWIGVNPTDQGSYSLSGGTLSCVGMQYVGANGTGTFNQTAGTNSITFSSSNLLVAGAAGSKGTYLLSGGSLSVSYEEIVGNNGLALFNQSGGSNSSSYLIVGFGSAGNGTFLLSGSGSLFTGLAEFVGYDGVGVINQTGGGNSVSTELDLGALSPGNGTYNLSGGTLALTSTAANNNLYVGGSHLGTGGMGVLNVSGTADLAVASTLQVYPRGKVNLTGGTAAVGNLAISTGGLVNVSSPLVINYGSGSDPITTIQQYLTNGYNAGAWNGAFINSSVVEGLNSSQSSLVYSVGYADGADGVVNGLSSGQIEIMPTLAGDAKLQGNVVFGDFQLLAGSFGSSAGWDGGNFTYGSIVNFGDFQLLAQNFGANASALTSGELSSLNGFAAEFGMELKANPNGVGFAVVSLPEPASAAVLATSALLLRRRAKRHPNAH